MDKEQLAIERIKLASDMSLKYYQQPLVCTYSGGKDSEVLLELFRRSGVPYEVQNSHTTVDAPPTVYHIRDVMRREEMRGIKANIHMPTYKGKRCSMWSLIVDVGYLPTRVARFCCATLKETSSTNRYIATGVRWAESTRRKNTRDEYEALSKNPKKRVSISTEIMMSNDNDDKRMLTEHCRLQKKSCVNPIIDWSDSDVWNFIRSERLKYNPLYDMGYLRVGCVGCPMGSYANKMRDFIKFPTYKDMYLLSIDKMLKRVKENGKFLNFKTAEEAFRWWIEDKTMDGQMRLDEVEDG